MNGSAQSARQPDRAKRGSVLLINPKITSERHARFPLSIMQIGATLEPQYESILIDGNVDRSAVATVRDRVRSDSHAAAGITVMGGPQVATAIEISRAVREARPDLPIIWGGYFPTLYPDVALNSDYVDFAIRGQGEESFAQLLRLLPDCDSDALAAIEGLSWRHEGATVHNRERKTVRKSVAPRALYGQLPDPAIYAARSFLGKRTVGLQAALGCRFRCTFCGVAAMFRGATALPPADHLDQELAFLKENVGADSVQFYDHNFFDREEETQPLLEVLARHQIPWWCYARADALVNLSAKSWKLVRKSRLRMAYIGAETPNDELLKSIRKGTRSEQTLEASEICRRNGVIPELSFMVAPPEDPEGETERAFDFIRKIKRFNPDAEIIVYIYTPLPALSVPDSERLRLMTLVDVRGEPVEFPSTPEQWTERPWLDYACHADAPWLTDRLRQRIRDFVTVLRCRFPTVQDTRTPAWAKATLQGLARWRYASRRYDRPWELTLSNRLIGLLDPRATSI